VVRQPSNRSLSQVSFSYVRYPFTTSMEERERSATLLFCPGYEITHYMNLSYDEKRVVPTPLSGIIIIIIIRPLQTAGHRPLQYLAISLDLRLASSSCQPPCANRHSTWPEGVLLYVYRDAVSTPDSFTPAVVGSTADMASPPLLQHANTVLSGIHTYIHTYIPLTL
jgi:hypothetical protein